MGYFVLFFKGYQFILIVDAGIENPLFRDRVLKVELLDTVGLLPDSCFGFLVFI